MDGKNIVQKAVDVLFFLATHPKGSKMSDIAKELRYPKATIFDILKTLMKNDFVHYIDIQKKLYGIGSQLYALGINYLDSSTLFTIARPYITLLADKYEKTTFIAKRHYDKITCVYKYVSPYARAPTGNIGDQKHLHSTSIGKCYLAFDVDAFPLLDTIALPAFTPYTITSRDQLRANIEEIRSRGYSWEQRESHIRMACVAAPIFQFGSMIGTISMTGWYKEDEDFTGQGNEIVQFARIISNELGKSGD
ncbi:MAG: IclR family transcriptional regulator [Spirochaetaceae bacterium]|jgi:DNA-binding IclR family transcriptional regulator|nr:IclR family transcriptional regulator [Spirochaetaceae bacterium]